MLLICHFAVDQAEAESFVTRAHRALRLLTAQPGCLGGELGRSPDETTRWVLVVRFDSVVAYRRALSPFEVREHVVPLLSEALTSLPGGYEVLTTAREGDLSGHASLLAAGPDRGTARRSPRGQRPGAR